MVASMGQKMAEANMLPTRPQTSGARNSSGARGSRLGQPIDIAYMALYLASDESKFVNGAAMKVDNTMTVTTGVVPDFG